MLNQDTRIILDYAPRERRLAELWQRNRKRLRNLLIACAGATAIYYCDVTVVSYTFDNARAGSATRQHLLAVGPHVVWHWSGPATFIYADAVAASDQIEVPIAYAGLQPRGFARWHLGFRHSQVDQPIYCRDGMWQLHIYQRAVWFVHSQMPTSTRGARRDVLIEIVRRSASLEGSYNRSDKDRFDAIAEEVMDKARR